MKRMGIALAVLVGVTLAYPASAAPPANDDFAGATPLVTLPMAFSQDLSDASEESDEPTPSCWDQPMFGTVWFSFTPAARTALAVDTFGGTRTVLAIYEGTDLGALEEVACNAGVWSATESPPHSHTTALLETAKTYHIQAVNLGFCCPGTNVLEITFERRLTTPGVRRSDPLCQALPDCYYGGTAWYLNNGFDAQAENIWGYGSKGGWPLVGDWVRDSPNTWYEGSGIAAPAVRRGSLWYLTDGWMEGPETSRIVPFGRAVAFPVVGDRNGDGATDLGVVDGNTWFFDTDLNGLAEESGFGFKFGSAGDWKLLGDWDGDGIFTSGVRKGNVWYLENEWWSDGKADTVFAYGSSGDFPIVGDWDGDGTWTAGVRKGNVWFLNNGADPDGDIVFGYAKASDFPLAGDWGQQAFTTTGVP
jgi:hypothetical protein